MRTCLVVILLLATASPALGHELSLAHNRGERAADWFEWSRAFSERLLDQGRSLEGIEELSVCAAMRPEDITSPARVAIELIEFASTPPNRLERGGQYYAIIQQFITEGVRRGGKGDPRLGYAIGRLYFADHDWDHAHQMLKQAVIDLESGEAPTEGVDIERVKSFYFRSAVNAAPTVIQIGRAEQVVTELGSLLEETPNGPYSPAARINLALAHQQMMDTVEAERILSELTKTNPDYGEAWNALGQILQAQARNEEALEAYQRAVDLATARGQPVAEPIASMASVLLRLDRHEEATEAVRRFMSLERDSPRGLYLLAKIRRAEGETKEAIILLRRAKRLDPRLWGAYTDLQGLHYMRGEHDEADAVKAELEAESAKARAEQDAARRQAAGDAEDEPEAPDDGEREPEDGTREPDDPTDDS